MSKRTDQEFLSDIREALHRSMAYVAEMAYESFVMDTKTQDAVIRNLEILGEATRTCRKNSEPNIPVFLGEAWPEPVTD
jgi:uncharacterized protein with HEPN domain